MIKHIIVINGEPRSGKDTFIEQFSKYYRTDAYSSIEAIKDIAKICGWNGEKTDKSRDFLSNLKRLTTEFNDFSHRNVANFISRWSETQDELTKLSPALNGVHTFLFLHIREPEEIQRMVDEFGVITLQLKGNPTNVQIHATNASDLNTDQFNYDYTIINDGTIDDLLSKAYQFGQNIIFNDNHNVIFPKK